MRVATGRPDRRDGEMSVATRLFDSRGVDGPILIGDLGGTNLRLALVREGTAEASATLPTADHPSLEAAIRHWLAAQDRDPVAAALAVAGPVSGDAVATTNLPWRFSGAGLARAFGWRRVELMNDFAAQALAMPLLDPREIVQIGGGTPIENGPKVVLGPGTGLGVCALIRDDAYWMPIPGEGGHMTLAAMDDEEAEILALVRAEHRHVSAERICSGIGLPGLYAALCRRDGARVEHPEPAGIAARAGSGDRRAREAMERFCRFLGTVAADLALIFWATGGVYLAGGIPPRWRETFLHSGFRARFEEKGRFSGALKSIPTFLVTAENPALRGLAAHVERW